VSPSKSERTGVLAAGLWLVDYLKAIDQYPAPARLAHISRVVRSNGGGAFNVACDLSRLGATFPISGVGVIGEDDDGRWILDRCRTHGVDTAGLRQTSEATTAFTDVMTEVDSGRRTFFYSPGANEHLTETDFDFSQTRARILYLGYPGLLPRLDRPREVGPYGVEKILSQARAAGMITAVDLVSADSDHWPRLRNALPQVDLLFSNEWEAARILGEAPVPENELTAGVLEGLAGQLLGCGVRQAVVVHSSKGAVCTTPNGVVRRGCVAVLPSEIQGTCGAGDALAAGFLCGFHDVRNVAECLELGLSAAATCLHHITSSEGVRPQKDCLDYAHQRGFAVF
jgi:sugar/nucleoside kinase (ribokinase family)